MPSVKSYYAGDFWGDIKQSLTWLYSRQNAPAGGWQGNALATVTAPQFAQAGIVSTADLSQVAQNPVENIVIDPPPGVLPDSSAGPDGFPINFSPVGLPAGNVLQNVFQNPLWQPVVGRCFSRICLPT